MECQAEHLFQTPLHQVFERELQVEMASRPVLARRNRAGTGGIGHGLDDRSIFTRFLPEATR